MTRPQHVPAKPAVTASPSSTPQRSGLLSRKCACGATPGPTGECEACRAKLAPLQRSTPSSAPATQNAAEVSAIGHEVPRSPGQPVAPGTRAFVEPRFGHDFSKVPVQTKLALSSPEDVCEKEAEQVAKEVEALSNTIGPQGPQSSSLSRLNVPRVMGMAGVSPRRLHSTVNSSRRLNVSARHDEQATEPATVPQATESRILQSRGTGRALPAHVQNLMALRTGYDFSSVRVKTGPEAEDLSRNLHARAFTLGSDVWLGRGESPNDVRLMAHELTHVVQQGAARPINAVSPPGLDRLAGKSTVMGYLQALSRGTTHDASLYEKEIDRFEESNSSDQIATLQRELLESPSDAAISHRSESKVMRDCGCSPSGGTGAPAPCAVPTNFRETARSRTANGVLHFEYAWDSSTGNLADLSACEVGEHVAYPAGFTNPPFGPRPNPTIIWLPASNGSLQDNHSTSHTTPYRNATLDAVQYYRFHCPCHNRDRPVNLMGPIAINRVIARKPDGKYKYTITKSGISNDIDPLP